MPSRASEGDLIQVIKNIAQRTSFYMKDGKQGTVLVDLSKGTQGIAATDELGGNIFMHYTIPAGDAVIVPLAEGEWKAI